MARALTVEELIERLSAFPGYRLTDVYEPPEQTTGSQVSIVEPNLDRAGHGCCCGEC